MSEIDITNMKIFGDELSVIDLDRAELEIAMVGRAITPLIAARVAYRQSEAARDGFGEPDETGDWQALGIRAESQFGLDII